MVLFSKYQILIAELKNWEKHVFMETKMLGESIYHQKSFG